MRLRGNDTGPGITQCGHRPGGWAHWYCQRHRWHRGFHRYINYVWRHGRVEHPGEPGVYDSDVQYNPLGLGGKRRRWPWEQRGLYYTRRRWRRPGRVAL